ncbi:MAG: rhamnulokinase [Armatimonadota bacterium]
MKDNNFLAFDLGAESGRTILGTLRDGQIKIQELNRFPTGMTNIRGTLHWNAIGFFEKMKEGMRSCAAMGIVNPDSIAVDTWGVDYALLARDGSIVSLPHAYRDSRTDGMVDEFFKIIPREKLYGITGIQVMQLNTIFQLFSMARQKSPLLEIARDLLFMPDFFSYLFTGEKLAEFSIASTSQLYNPIAKQWDKEIFDAVGVPVELMQEIVSSGTVISGLSPDICRETGIQSAKVIATTGHDTASAIAAAPAEGTDWAYISSGTWSLMGIESDNPIISDKALQFNFSNEGGVGGTFRVLKNIMGMWLIQQCRKSWAKDRLYEYSELAEMAGASAPFKSIVDPDYNAFLNPLDMPEAINNFCSMTKQDRLETPGEFARCIAESLALKYRMVLDQLREIKPSHQINKIHIIGGGTQNEMLCQFTANATGLEVIAGPIEATAVGNILVQAMSLGLVKSRSEIREIVRNSFPMKRFEPEDVDVWNKAYARFREIINSD